MRKLVLLAALLPALAGNAANTACLQDNGPTRFQNITLETSLKPFKKKDQASINEVAVRIFTQWQHLLKHADTVSVMLWTSDGSEILNYTGNPGQRLEWAKYIGNPNTRHAVGAGPESLSLHERAYLYMNDPPEFTYADLKLIVETLRRTGQQLSRKPVKIGATFDPGPEFAKSEFKYEKHPEILQGNAMGHKTFVSCYALLHADSSTYAGFPNGIPANTPFGTFFGRQSAHFLRDLDFDFLWLSNGFGFGVEPWSATGAVFTGSGFLPAKLDSTRSKITSFWTLFRKECSYEVQTRGSNLTTGIDLARDGVDLQAIYKGGFNILPPPNSPWAAIDGDFGLEMAGFMSHIAELPDHRYVYRFYTHDPWWLNSPWLDRYGRYPHDIYLPMSVSRIDDKGKICLPTNLNFLTIDNSFGDMPEVVPNEVVPHILRAREDAPTAAGPLVWVYPFDEYHLWAKDALRALPEIYYGDWFIRQAINNGLPLNTVISSSAFNKLLPKDPAYFNSAVLFSIIPDAGSALEKQLISFVRNGGRLVLYGPADRAGKELAALMNLANAAPLEGAFTLKHTYQTGEAAGGIPDKIRHLALFSGGGLRTTVKDYRDPYTSIKATAEQNGQRRDLVWVRSHPGWKGGKLAYLRGTNSSSFKGGMLLKPDDPAEWFIAPKLARMVLEDFGYSIGFRKEDISLKSPVLSIARSNNGFFFSGYAPNTTVRHTFRFPQGAPLLHGYDTRLENGSSTYMFPTAWHQEARVFVEQENGIVSSKEVHSGQLGISRRIQVTGLRQATVRVYADEHVDINSFHAYLNAGYPWKTGKIAAKQGPPALGRHFVLQNITGTLTLAW